MIKLVLVITTLFFLSAASSVDIHAESSITFQSNFVVNPLYVENVDYEGRVIVMTAKPNIFISENNEIITATDAVIDRTNIETYPVDIQ